MKKWGIGLAAGMTAMALSAPAMALDVTPYGAIRVATFWMQNDFYNAAGLKKSDNDFSLDLQGDSLVGIRVKEGNFSAVAELGAYNPKVYSTGAYQSSPAPAKTIGNTGINPEVRLLFGEWDFGGGKVRIGKTPSPYVYRTQQVWDSDGGMNGYGSLWDGRYAQIKLTLDNGLYFTAMQPRKGAASNNTDNINTAAALAQFSDTGNTYSLVAYNNYNTVMPKMVIGYEGKVSKLAYGGGVAYNFYNVESFNASATKTANYDIHSYLIYFHGKLDLAPVELSYNVFGGRNTGDLMSTANTAYVVSGAAGNGHNTAGYFNMANAANASTFGGWGQIGYTVDKKWKVYAGASYVVDDHKNSIHADERFASFINAQYQVTKNFKIVPEFDFINDMQNSAGAKEPRQFIVGAKWEMVF